MENTESSFPDALSGLKSQHLLTYVGNQLLAFPSRWVAEIILTERSLVLSLPFYNPLLLGIFHHQGAIVPAISGHLMLSKKSNLDIGAIVSKETLFVIRLSQLAEHLSGAGIVVDRVVNHVNDGPTSESSTQSVLFQLTDVPSLVWQPM